MPKRELFDYFQAIRANEVASVKSTLDQADYDVNFANTFGMTAAHIATISCKPDILELLAAYEANFNVVDTRGWGLLHIAALHAHHEGYAEVFALLLRCGADSAMPLQKALPTPSWSKEAEPAYEPKLPWECGVQEVQEKLKSLCASVKKDDQYIQSLQQKFKKSQTVSPTVAKSGAPTPQGTEVVLFPGQGTQFVGMCADVLNTSVGKEMFSKASVILGYDLAEVCLRGPEEKLLSTAVSQPAVMVASLVAFEQLREKNPDAINKIGHMAGFSLGEYTALVAAGALSFEDGLRVVRARAESMQVASISSPGTMASIVGLDDATLNTLVSEVKKGMKGNLEVANLLFPKGRVVSGDHLLIDEVVKKATAAKALKAAKLQVGGAFHTMAMSPARDAIEQSLNNAELRLPSNILIYSNVTGRPYTSAQEMRECLLQQCVSPVQWENTMVAIVKTEGKIYEAGPGEQLKAMVKRMDQKAWQRTENVGHWIPPKK